MANGIIPDKLHISIHAPAGGATAEIRLPAYETEFQFTPLREGRRSAGRLFCRKEEISIHAPAGGATHAQLPAPHSPENFNSRPCGRGDCRGKRPVVVLSISIHAPAGGATSLLLTGLPQVEIFQFTPLREGRRRLPAELRSCIYFNSRPCGRGDKSCAYRRNGFHYFNSRPCGRGDARKGGQISGHHISIHAPAGGATQAEAEDLQRQLISIHAPAGGATYYRRLLGRMAVYFNSRPCGRGDGSHGAGPRCFVRYFNSRPCGRGDRRACR